jgi:hypothetical protein
LQNAGWPSDVGKVKDVIPRFIERLHIPDIRVDYLAPTTVIFWIHNRTGHVVDNDYFVILFQ